MTHRVCVLPREGLTLRDSIESKAIEFPEYGLAFDKFVSFPDGWWSYRPPFDHVMVRDLPAGLDTDVDLVFPLADVRFVLQEWKEILRAGQESLCLRRARG